MSPQHGGVALLWEEGHQDFEVEAVTIVSPNLLKFQLVTGEERYFVMGAYIPPADTTGVDDLRTAWAARPTNCKPLLLGDFNINFQNPQTEQEEIIADFLDKINVVDTSRKFIQRKGRRQGPGARWTWQQLRGGRWYHSQPDYVMAREVDTKAFWSVGFRQPRFHDSDHRAVVANIMRGRKGRLKKYRRSRQKFPLQLAPLGEQDEVTRLFGRLKEECKETNPKKQPWNDWISEETWRLIAHRAMLRRAGCLCRTGGGVGYTVKLELLFAPIGGIEPHALARFSSPSLWAATSRRLSVTCPPHHVRRHVCRRGHDHRNCDRAHHL
jgi:hypothetical protein